MQQPSEDPSRETADDLLHRLRQREQLRFFEYQHQMRGLLAGIRAITRRSALTAVSIEEFAAHLEGRIDAVSRVHGILMRMPGATADLMELVCGELLAQAIPEERCHVGGPQVSLSAKPAASLALALHELTTNAIKFGALATSEGCLDITWTREPRGSEIIRLDWREVGLSISSPAPAHKGFGLELIERTLPYELRARTTLEFKPGGVHCVIVFAATGWEQP
jgi:two-component system, chemotaxis family, CheB/CheR fusion protein